MLRFLLFCVYAFHQTVNGFLDLSEGDVEPVDKDGKTLHLQPLAAKPGKYEINFGTLVDEFKNIEVQRQSALKGMLQNPDVTRSNRTAKFLEVARELDTAFMQIRIYCDAAQVVFKTTNFTHPDNNFLQAAAVMKKEKKLDDQIMELSDLFDRMETSVKDLTEEECDPLQPFVLCISYGQMKLEQLAAQFNKDYEKTLLIAGGKART
nr:PREDICTED: uncharacterized protein LOC109042349 [Bemisia tabaci]